MPNTNAPELPAAKVPPYLTPVQAQESVAKMEVTATSLHSRKARLEDEIASLDTNLRPEVIAERSADLRRDAGADMRSLRDKLEAEFARVAGQDIHYTPEAVRIRAAIDQPSDRIAAARMVLGSAPDQALHFFGDLAAGTGDQGLAGLLLLELWARNLSPEVRAPLAAAIDQVPLLGREAMQRSIAKAAELKMRGDLEFLEATAANGAVDPTIRLTLARQRQAAGSR